MAIPPIVYDIPYDPPEVIAARHADLLAELEALRDRRRKHIPEATVSPCSTTTKEA
jgi:hypothetical protein